ncbi:geranylgeranylglycerol-phosphate geranylgeranyltransferase [Flammeovirga sp. EKP202]|uniref:geranylgeranylglycerol-phosphate geranylgeranyltransferase n=1 Tax=Flammeovirga sp. EKP202 TaxID=2770592 RepID=UPI00165F1490|nr:geranylgeranylglycerol-phosphate geranylgeranyltransferase [Flammeovirga sp. EKP202]MBD0402665.1 geranylgeranylglycerol-phosphate geranylgeranyltransferase [Flammeovirga sp. EKP202]
MSKPQTEQTFFINLKDFLSLIRANNLLIILYTQWMGRIFLVGPSADWRYLLQDVSFWLLTLSTLLIAASGYIINDYYDIKIDAVNRPNKQVIGKLMRRRVAIFTHTVFNLIGIVIGFSLSLEVGIVCFIASFWLWLYSNELKRRAFIGNVSVAAITALSIFLINIYFAEHNRAVYEFGIFSFFVSLIREIIKDLEDKEGDVKFGCRTLPIIWGDQKTKKLIYLLFALFIAISFVIVMEMEEPYIQYYFCILSLPAFMMIYKLIKAVSSKDYGKISSFIKYYMVAGILGMFFI